MKTCYMYLRKSRKDLERERIDKINTLDKHKSQLTEWAKKNNIIISKVFAEVVSGESLFERPKMLKLLDEVSENPVDGVLAMDIDRLGRGSLQEQGLILETLKYNNCMIFTPNKIYDLNDESDEDYSEFEALMARKELRIIKRRLLRGRIQTVKEGGYLANPPYGYKSKRINGSPSLVIVPHEAEIVRKIFDMYIHGNCWIGFIFIWIPFLLLLI